MSHAEQKHWELETDVIVIGCGFAGATAAITASDAGAEVLMLEKAPKEHRGGNSRVSANLVFWPTDVERAKVYFTGLAGTYMDNIPADMLQTWAEGMHENRAWLEGLGMDPVEFPLCEFPEIDGSDCVRVLMHGKGDYGQERLWKLIAGKLDARPVDIRYETPAKRLVRENGSIVGVIAETEGREIAIRARRAVVLTCGGFEANPEMVRTYLDGLPEIYPDGSPYNTGDGVRMGIEVGADLWHMNNVSGPILSFKAPEIEVAHWINLPHCNSYMFVGADATRFTREGEPCSVGDRHGKVLRNGVWVQQPIPAPVHMIFDETMRAFGPVGSAHADWDVSHGNRYDWSKDNLREVEKGWIVKADTLDDLAAKIGLPVAKLKESVARFNMFANAGRDADWDRPADRMAPIETAPFYAMKLTPAFVNTQGGPRRDKEARVISTEGAPIPRLYSAGELGSIYSYLYQGGGNIGECFAFGRIAGRNAAAEAPMN